MKKLLHAEHNRDPADKKLDEQNNLPVNMIRPHLEDIPGAPLPEGFRIRSLKPGEGTLWTDIQRDAEPFFAVADDLFQLEYGSDPQATEQRVFFTVTDAGVAVGTISAWYSRDFRGRDYGRIHWVATRPSYQGRGLAKAALSHALKRMAKWHERCWLATSTGRLGALKLYLNFGFLPDLEPEGALRAWRSVQAKLEHPVLWAALTGADKKDPGGSYEDPL